MTSLRGKTAVVTGASSGIGLATARALEQAGARVAGGARRVERLETDVRLELDVTDPGSSERFVEQAIGELGGLDILVNNAGLALSRDPVWDSTEEDERIVIETNVNGLIRMTRLCVPHIRDGGHIVNLGSVAGVWAYPHGAAYCAAKAAVHVYTRGLREDLHGRPIRITNMVPGLVHSEFSKVRFHGDEEKAEAVYADVALGGAMQPEDVAECILFALTRPANVNVDEIVVTALAQTTGANILRDST
ncbi:MAG: NAD(P)-dependent oxidoreductase [Candidatus Rokuibacteriota bacterium]|nr:MAG: NAD(P)-dependent oxidoreductase [Candidatus Rokubacteria bacterium]